MILLLTMLTCLMLVLTLLYVTMGEQPKRFKFSYYFAIFQAGLAAFTGITALVAPIGALTCLPGFAGVYLNPLATLVDTISLLTLLPAAIRTKRKKIIALYLLFVVVRFGIHILAGSAHYWIVSICTVAT